MFEWWQFYITRKIRKSNFHILYFRFRRHHVILTIFLVKSSKPNTVQCSLLLAAAAWLSKESGNQEKKRHAAQHNFSFWPNKEKRKDDDKDEANKKAT